MEYENLDFLESIERLIGTCRYFISSSYVGDPIIDMYRMTSFKFSVNYVDGKYIVDNNVTVYVDKVEDGCIKQLNMSLDAFLSMNENFTTINVMYCYIYFINLSVGQ